MRVPRFMSWIGGVVLVVGSISAAAPPATNPYAQRFDVMWQKLHDAKNGYFSPDGVPYHSIETLICEAPDYGHETTSEAFSYWIWLEAMRGKFSGDWAPLAEAWQKTEQCIIPSAADQPGFGKYPPGKPAAYAAEGEMPEKYPSPLDPGLPVGADPIHAELRAAYGDSVYGMHWLMDVDNWYGYGNHGDGTSRPAYINTFQRGPQESVFETVPHPSWEAFKWGGKNGFLDLFVKDQNYAKQWRYTNAPDADARAIGAMYWATQWAEPGDGRVALIVSKASKMGDWLRGAMFDKYFKPLGAQRKDAAGGKPYDSCHYLLSWYYAWGGAADGGWAWKVGCSHIHFGYQNPLAAWALSTQTAMKPKSANGARDWARSLERQIEFYQWLQSSEGAIAGGATNSWNGRYEKYPTGTSTFYGMAYQENPVYADPGSNTWFGFQTWSMQRLAEYYYVSGDAKAGAVVAKWVHWAMSGTAIRDDGSFEVPSTLEWSGQPDMWTGKPTGNEKLHVKVTALTSSDIGIAASLANTLCYYSAATKKWGTYDDAPRAMAQKLLDSIWGKYRDEKGVSAPEERADYKRFFEQEVYVPAGWTGVMANGDVIKSGVKFIDIRSKYRQDPAWPELERAYKAGKAPVFRYHRFWAQCEVAIANGTYAILFPN